jgi:hypothetical protein
LSPAEFPANREKIHGISHFLSRAMGDNSAMESTLAKKTSFFLLNRNREQSGREQGIEVLKYRILREMQGLLSKMTAQIN